MSCHRLPKDMDMIPNGPLSRMYNGLRSLPHMVDVCGVPLELGDWCYAAPLWGNPLLPASLMGEDLALLRSVPGMKCCGDMLTHGHNQLRAVLFLWHLGVRFFSEQAKRENIQMGLAISRIPQDWIAAATAAHAKVAAGTILMPTLSDALAVILPRLGWHHNRPGRAPRTIHLMGLSVRDATALQLGNSDGLRLRMHTLFINEAYGRAGETPLDQESHRALLKILGWCWSLEWENKQKEIFWRMAIDGVQDGHRWASLARQGCACGGHVPRREHYFWSCPVAQAVVGAVEGCCPGHPTLSKVNLWLMPPPGGSISRSGL